MRVHSGLKHTPIFVPSVGRFAQGMLVSIPLPLWNLPKTPSAKAIHEALSGYYAGKRFVAVTPFEDRPGTLDSETLNGTNRLELFVFDNPEEESALLVVAWLNNLGKGSSGAAC